MRVESRLCRLLFCLESLLLGFGRQVFDASDGSRIEVALLRRRQSSNLGSSNGRASSSSLRPAL